MQDLPNNPAVDGEAAQPTTVGAKLMNVFISPAEVFDEVKAAPFQMWNWLLPLIIAAIAGIIYSMVVFSQPTIMQHMLEPVEAQMQKLVDSGKITRAQADQRLEMAEKFMTPTLYKIIGIGSSLILPGIMMLVAALAVWLIGKFLFQGTFGFDKAIEVAGLASVITIPGTLIAMFLAVIYGNMYMKLSPVLFIGHFDPNNTVHMFLSTLELFTMWYLGVVAVGLSRLSGASFLKSAICGYLSWAVMTGIMFLSSIILKGAK